MEVDLWGWYYDFHREAVQKGDAERQQLRYFYQQAWDQFETAPQRSLTLLNQGRALADKLDEPCWKLFFDYWRCEAYLFYLDDLKSALDLAVRTSVEARKPVYQRCPVLARVYRILVDAYVFSDPIGYADKIQETLNYLEKEVALDKDTRLLIYARRAYLESASDRLDEATAFAQQYLAASEGDDFRQTHAYGMLCDYAFRRNDLDALLGYAREGEIVAQKSDSKSALVTFYACRAFVMRKKGNAGEALELYRLATAEALRLGVPPSGLRYAMLCAYHEAGGQSEEALRLRDKQLAEAIKSGNSYSVCQCHLKRCYLLARMDRPLDAELAAGRKAAQQLRNPIPYLAKLDALERQYVPLSRRLGRVIGEAVRALVASWGTGPKGA